MKTHDDHPFSDVDLGDPLHTHSITPLNTLPFVYPNSRPLTVEPISSIHLEGKDTREELDDIPSHLDETVRWVTLRLSCLVLIYLC
jgi:hypothetical protein